MKIPNPSSLANISAFLEHFKINGVQITRVEEDRVYGWDTLGDLLAFVIAQDFMKDSTGVAQAHHGKTVIASYRDRGTPSLQVCLHGVPPEENGGQRYFVELDLDFVPPDPRRPDRVLLHGLEVVKNKVTKTKTDQVAIAKKLESRFTSV